MMMKLTLVLLLVGVALAKSYKDTRENSVLDHPQHDSLLDDVWEQYKITHKKKYSLKEEHVRRSIWEQNAGKVRKHNLEYDLGKHTFTMGINEYADLTWDEYKQLLGARPPPPGARSNASETFDLSRVQGMRLPDEVDWRQKGYVTPIKNQGQCGSCWAFSTTGSLEGAHFKKTGNLTSLSEQNLVDCTEKYGNAGCNGGWMDNAFKYVEDNGGIDLENAYPYEARDDTCRYMDYYKGSTVAKFVDVKPSQSEDALQAAVATAGPVSVAIDAAHQSFQLYRSGVYFEDSCSSTQSDHAVLVVGYGITADNYHYWLVKNSWGTSWGMDGYIMMARGYDNMCAIATYASYPVV